MTINRPEWDGDPGDEPGNEDEERFWSRALLRTPDLPAPALADRESVFATLARLVGGADDAAGRAAARAVLGRWIRRHRLLPGHLRGLVAALPQATTGSASGDPGTPDGRRAQPEWDRAEWDRQVAVALLRTAGRTGDGPAWRPAELVGHARPAEGIAILTVRPDQPLPFQPGQAVPVGLPGCPGVWRWYCPANAPRRDGTIDLHIRAIEGGRLSTRLVHSARVGDRLRLGPASGRGLVPGRTGRRDLLLIAGGTGWAPLRAIVEQLIGEQGTVGQGTVGQGSGVGSERRQVTLVVGARSVEQLYDAVTLDRWQQAYDWLTILPAFSEESSPPVHPLELGGAVRVALRQDWAGRDIFLCGPPAMIRDALPRLVVAGVPLARIHLPETYEDGSIQEIGRVSGRLG